MDKNKIVILTIFGYLISLSLLVIVFKDTNFERVLGYLKKIDPRIVRDSKFRKRLNAYLDSDLATQSEEAMTLAQRG